MIDDSSLLRRFVEQSAEDAFTELVRRHRNLVYFAALRQTNGDRRNTRRASKTSHPRRTSGIAEDSVTNAPAVRLLCFANN